MKIIAICSPAVNEMSSFAEDPFFYWMKPEHVVYSLDFLHNITVGWSQSITCPHAVSKTDQDSWARMINMT